MACMGHRHNTIIWKVMGNGVNTKITNWGHMGIHKARHVGGNGVGINVPQ